MPDLLPQFITSFQKALTVEMEAMCQRLGPFDVPLVNGRVLAGKEDDPWKLYTFHVAKPNDKPFLQVECTLATASDCAVERGLCVPGDGAEYF